MKKTDIFSMVVVTLLICSCTGIDGEELGVQLVYMPQACMYNGGISNEYPVPMTGLNIDNYNITEDGQLTIPLGVYRSGRGRLQSYSVGLSFNQSATDEALGTIKSAVALPEGSFTIPSSVSVKDGQRDEVFHLNVDMAAIRQEHPDYYQNKLIAAFSINNPSRYELNPKLSTVIVSIDGKSFIEAPPTPPEPELKNLVVCGDFEDNPEEHWIIKNINNDPEEVMCIKNGHLEISRSSASDKDYRFVCYNKLDAPLEAGKWYKMSVKINVAVPVTWYARGIDLGFCVFGIDPATLKDYKANKDNIFFVDTDMENARKEVGPLHGTDGFVNFPTVCTYCNPADLKTNGGVFQAVEGQQWVGFYLRQRNTLAEMNKIIFDDIVIAEVDEP